jgi:hypothetical protein
MSRLVVDLSIRGRRRHPRRRQLHPRQSKLVAGCGHDPNLEFGRHFGVELDADRVETEFLQHAFELDLVAGNRKPIGLESGHDFGGADATVQVSIFVGVGFDVDRLLADLIDQGPQSDQALLVDLDELGSVLVDHPLVVIVCDNRQTFWEKVVVGVTRLDLDNVTRLAEVLDVLDQHELDAAVGAFWQPGELRNSLFRRGHDCVFFSAKYKFFGVDVIA